MLLWLLAACLQCGILYALWRGSRAIILQSMPPKAPAILPENVPTVAMIIPAAGNNPLMPAALTSLLEQDYPCTLPVIVTASEEDPAYALAQQLQEKYTQLELVVAGKAELCGQKNHNTLKALEHVGARADIYVFCDSTHDAKANFVRELIWPIVSNEAGITTGYHAVIAKDSQCVTLGYQISVLLMRFLQAVAVFTQPWGGAMAMARSVYENHNIATFWQNNVVDDCSLASMLMKKRLHVQLCPHAILETRASNHSMHVWQAWMERQVLFLKFCVMPQWFLLGFFACIMTLPVLISCLFLVGGLTNILPMHSGWMVFFALAHLGILCSIALAWRELIPNKASALHWLKAFFLSSAMFLKVYLRTLKVWHIDWHGNRYYVERGGIVRQINKI